MNFILTPVEVRILGCLIEKEATTPDVYPLTLNSLLTACNQKSSREPVMDLTTEDLMPALDNLIDKTLVATWASGHNRTVKYRHKLNDRISDKLDFSLQELAVLGVLFLRGPQTVGEIRTRSARMHEFDTLDHVAQVLKALERNPDGPYVTMMPRQEGRKESRYAHLFCGEPAEIMPPASEPGRVTTGVNARVESLALEVQELKSALELLEQRLDDFMKQFE